MPNPRKPRTFIPSKYTRYTVTESVYCLATGTDAPGVQVCPRSVILFPQTSDVVPVGCSVCILEGDVITLNCTGRSASEVSYEWRNSDGLVVSTSPLLITGAKDEYTCTARTLDHSPEIAASSVASCEWFIFTGVWNIVYKYNIHAFAAIQYSVHCVWLLCYTDTNAVTFTARTKEEFPSAPQVDNGCSRYCVFHGCSLLVS